MRLPSKKLLKKEEKDGDSNDDLEEHMRTKQQRNCD